VVQDSLCLGFKSVVVEDSRCLRLKTVVKDSAEFPSWHMACHHARVLEGVVKRQFSLQDSSVWRATRARVLEGVAKSQLALQSISFKSQAHHTQHNRLVRVGLSSHDSLLMPKGTGVPRS
jgi:hypothetical protein